MKTKLYEKLVLTKSPPSVTVWLRDCVEGGGWRRAGTREEGQRRAGVLGHAVELEDGDAEGACRQSVVLGRFSRPVPPFHLPWLAACALSALAAAMVGPWREERAPHRTRRG